MIKVIYTKDHPWVSKVQGEKFEYGSEYSLNSQDIVMDLTILDDEKKEELISSLSANLYCDFSVNHGAKLTEKYPQIKGSFAGVFFSPNNAFEYCGDEAGKEILKDFGKLIAVKSAGIGFTFPRTLCMIINEAYFAMDENVACEDDIDLAMKFGVNYPLGPIEWAQKSGLNNVKLLLDTLFKATQDRRYIKSKNL